MTTDRVAPTWTDGARLSLGTLTVIRVGPPSRVDASVGGAAMSFAPVVGLVLGGIAAAVAVGAHAIGLSPFLCAVSAIGTLAVLTRAIHLDGLADTADGLGSGRDGDDALDVMSRSDVGPFGVITLVLVLAVQIGALTQAWDAGRGAAAIVVATLASRAALPIVCRRGVPAAKLGGLGAAVAATVGPVRLAVVLVSTLIVAAAVGATVGDVRDAALAAVACVAAWTAAVLMLLRCVERLGGVTGDVLGACVEIAAAAALLVLAVP